MNFFKPKRTDMTANTDSQRNEVLFFATAHFLFFNFMPAAQNTLSFFCNRTKLPQKKNERVFSPSLCLTTKFLSI